MKKIGLPGLLKEKLPSGNFRFRVRVEGRPSKRIPLTVTSDHPEFLKQYEQAREGIAPKPVDVDPKGKRGTLDALKDAFLAALETEVEAGNLSPLTLSSRRTGLKQVCDARTPNGRHRFGQLQYDLPRDAINKALDSFGTRTAAADTALKALRAMYLWGAENGFPSKEEVLRVKRRHRSKGGASRWSDEDVAQFLKAHPPGSMARRWFRLAEDTSGRIGDMHTRGPKDLQAEGNALLLSYQPGKKGSAEVTTVVSGELWAEIKDVPEDQETFLQTEYGKPFASAGSLDNRVRKWVIEAGLCTEILNERTNKMDKKATRSQHGIRKHMASKAAEEGATEAQIMAMLSHIDPATAKHYVAEVDRRKLSIDGADLARRSRVTD